MSIKVFYNEIDQYCCAWLSNLMDAGHIRPGTISDKSIADLTPDAVREYDLAHFFAGIGVWDLALTQAGWRPRGKVTWTGSCPCQPFSAAGKRGGAADERHLWPAWSWLIRQCKPGVVFGEQVASKDGRNWLDLVQTDLEGMGFAVGAGDICAAGVGAPHIRQRLYFVADAECGAAERHGHELAEAQGGMQSTVGSERLRLDARNGEHAGELADPMRKPLDGRGNARSRGRGELANSGLVGHSDNGGSQGRRLHGATGSGNSASECAVGAAGITDGMEQPCGVGRERREAPAPRHDDDGQASERQKSEYGPRIASTYRSEAPHFWSACDWLPCIDGKARPVEPGTFPLVNGASARVGRLRAYGNALVAPCAETFIRAYLDTRD